ncbi:TetR/AcrR family transcriptional regulator [Paenibacillus sp. 2TAB23]|uniref:TetR/AcrR family transcriptional regulator n=1 Tax=Paenibacillus sp. 2TAB23 TaxID=3233004 RepID=UPI003F99A7CE
MNLTTKRSEETKQAILAAAEKLFSERGYATVTIRQIAEEAGCSHTTIYIYFQDKEALLYALSTQPLELLKTSLDMLSDDAFLSSDEKLRRLNEQLIRFCLDNRSMYSIFFEANSARVDESEPELAINRMRQHVFHIISRLLGTYLNLPDGDGLLSCSRIYFYMLRGIVGSYTQLEESADSIMARLSPTFHAAFDALLLGFDKQLQDRNG